jgi:hypothetical protein
MPRPTMRCRVVFLAAPVLAAALMLAALAGATTLQPDRQVRISGTGGAKDQPTAASDPRAGRQLVAWGRHPGDRSVVQVRLLRRTSSALAGPHDVTRSEHDVYALDPAVAFDARARRYLVAWQEWRNGHTEVMTRILSAHGRALGSQRHISQVPSGDQADPGSAGVSVAWSPRAHRFLVAYSYLEFIGRETTGNVRLQGVDPRGRQVPPYDSRISREPRLPAHAAVAPVAARNTRTGDLVVGWTDSDRVGERTITARRVSAFGRARGGPVRIAARANHDLTLRGAAFDPSSPRFLFVFDSLEMRFPGRVSVAARAANGRGGPVGRVREVARLGDPGSTSGNPQLLSTRRFLVVFDHESRFEDREIYAQVVDPAGRRLLRRARRVSRMGREPRSPTDPALAFHGMRPALAPPMDAAALVLWEGTLPGVHGGEIYGRRLLLR